MFLVWSVSGVSAILAVACVGLLRRDFRTAPRSWRWLAVSGPPLALAGLGFILRFWRPLPGPYLANESYPLGPYVNTWAVSFGFMWLAYGLAFFALAIRMPRDARSWAVLLVTWILAWLPHFLIGVGFAVAGSNRPSVGIYRAWASSWPGLFVLAGSAIAMLLHFVFAACGFSLAALQIRRAEGDGR